MKKSIYFLCSIFLSLMILNPLHVAAAEEKCGDNVYWRHDSSTNTITIYGTGPMYDYNLISSTQRTDTPWDGYLNCSFVVEEGVTRIGNYAFANRMFDSFTIPDSVESVGGGAFYNCAYLTDIYFGEGLKTIPTGVFQSCNNLENIHIPSLEYWLDSEKDWYFEINDYTSVTALVPYNLCVDGEKLTDIVIPESITKIRPNAFRNQLIESVSIPDSVIEIGDFAFAHYNDSYHSATVSPVLKNIEIPDSVEDIGDFVLYNNTNLRTVILPESLEVIPDYMCYNCTSLQSIEIPQNTREIGNRAFEGCKAMTMPELNNGLEKIGNYAFNGMGITTVVLPDSVKEIGATPFGTSLTNIGLSKNLEIIGNSAFAGCKSLKSITLYDKVKVIGDSAFSNCTGLVSMNIPDSVETIGSDAFKNCTSKTTIDLPNSITSIGAGAFEGSAIVEIDIPDNITEIAPRTFYGCNLSYVEIPDKVESIGDYAFYNNAKLTGVVLPDGLKSIGSYAFYDDRALGKVTFPESLEYVGNHAFKNCYAMTTDKLPDSITFIGEHGFDDCKVMDITRLPAGLTELNYCVFAGCHAFTDMTIPANMKNIGEWAFYCCFGLKNVTFEGDAPTIAYNSFQTVNADCYYPQGNSTYTSAITTSDFGGNLIWHEKDVEDVIDKKCGDNIVWEITDTGVLKLIGEGEMYDYSHTEKVYAPWYEYRTTIKSIEIGEGITYLGSYAFYDCKKATAVSIPETVTDAGKSLFENCTALKDVVLPDSLTYIPSAMFYGCSNLVNVDFPKMITEIGSSAFSDCINLASVVLPEGLTTIGFGAFSNCGYNDNGYNSTGYNFKSVTLPSTIKRIETMAFSWCQSLGTINLPYGLEYIGDYAFDYTYVHPTVIPSTVKYIGNGAFKWCRSLKTLYFYGDAPEFGGNAFQGGMGTQFTTCYYPRDNETWTADIIASQKGYTEFIPWGATDEPGAGGSGGDTSGDEGDTELGGGTGDNESTGGDTEGGDNTGSGGGNSGSGSGSGSEGGSSGENGEGTGNNINVSVNNGAASIGGTVAGPVNGWVEGSNTFTVTCDVPCTVAYSNDGGTTYIRVKAVATDKENTYSFTVENMTAQTIVGISVTGDTDGNGKINIIDCVQLKAATLGTRELSPLNKVTCDTDGNGKINIIDCVQLKAATLGTRQLTW